MPTPLSVARQCLSAEAAAALNDAVAVAKRRSHSQTTSLHAVSALLSPPSSNLREACARSGRSACSPGLQLRALELCVGVALDRVSVSKSAGDDPPVSNSLMAAIKRSQGIQKRHPETFHLYQQHLSSNPNNSSISAVKVDLKHFVSSILDDPIVNRVFNDAGFRTNEIKWEILNPSMSRFSTLITRNPPLFSCGLSDLELDRGRTFQFGSDTGNIDDSSRRISEILMKSNRRNPLLIGVYANDTLVSFVDSLKRGENGVLPKEIEGLSVVSIEVEISEFMNGSVSEEMIGLKFKHVCEMMENCKGPGVLVNCGNLKAFLDVENVDSVNYVVCEMKRLMSNSGGKLWLIGALAGDYDYKKILERFPSIDVDWDLHLMPVTNSPKTCSMGGMSSKSSLMGSFVPLGGFFSMPTKHETVRTTATQSLTRCTLCNEKYQKEVSAVLKGESNSKSAVDQHSLSLSPWLRVVPCQTSYRSDAIEAQNDKSILNAKVMAIQRKWNEICQQLHFSWTSQEDMSPAKSQTSSACTSSPLVISVTTDLQLGTLYPSEKESNEKLNLQEHHNVIQSFSESSKTHEYVPTQVVQSSSSSQKMEKQMYTKDLELPWKALAEKIYWQTEAIQTISETVSRCSNKRNIWLSFVGPDKVTKRKVAAAVAEIVFGKKENILSFDLMSLNVARPSNSIFDSYGMKYHGRKMIVDYLAEELSKRPQSVVLLENIEKADFLVQNSLSQAIKTGKFPDSHGRDINVNNKVFILTSGVVKGCKNLFGQVESDFSEETILEATNFQIQLSVGALVGNQNRYSYTNVSVTPSENIVVKKRKLIDSDPTKAETSKRRLPRSIIDLNLPVEDTGDESDIDKCDDDDNESSENSKSWLEELLEHVDANVVFKPFEFDLLARNILKEINTRSKRVVGDRILLEIDRKVMIQMLAAAWLTDKKTEFNDWIESVLCSSIKEAREKCNLTYDLVMNLVPCDERLVEEQANGVCLPARINLN